MDDDRNDREVNLFFSFFFPLITVDNSSGHYCWSMTATALTTPTLAVSPMTPTTAAITPPGMLPFFLFVC